MDVVTLFFAVIVSLLLTKYLPPHATYLETLRGIKDEIQKVLSKIAEFGGELSGLKSEIASEVEKATNEIRNLKGEGDDAEVREELQKIVSQTESFSGLIQKLKDELSQQIQKQADGLAKLASTQGNDSSASDLSNISSKLTGIEEQIKNAIAEMAKLAKAEPSDKGSAEVAKELGDKLADLNNTIADIKAGMAKEVHQISGQIDQLKAQHEILTTFIEEGKKSHLPEQFELYNGLWISLVELKTIVNELWEYPNRDKAKKLAKQVLETRKMLEQSAIFVPETLFNKLMDIMQDFENIQFGKISLVKLRNVSVKNKDFPEEELKTGLENNAGIKDNYVAALDELKKFIRENIVEKK